MTGPPPAGAAATPAPSPQAPAPDRSITPGWKTNFRLQLGISTLSVFAVNATRPFITYQALALGASTVEIGLIQSAFSVLPAFTAVVIGRLVDRGGEARYLALAMLLLTVGTAGASLSTTLVILAASQLLAGMGQILNLVSSQAMVANRGPREGREARFGSYAVANSFGQLGGPVVAGLLAGSAIAAAAEVGASVAGYQLADGQRVFLVSAAATTVALGFATAILLRTRAHDRVLARARAEAIRGQVPDGMLRAAVRVFRRSGMPAAMTVSIIVISVVDVLIAYLPVYGNSTGLAVAVVGLLLSVRAGASLVSRLFMARTIAVLGRERTLASSMALAGLGIGVVPFTDLLPVLIVAMIAAGLGLGLCQPMTIAWVAQRSPRADRGTALGVRLTGNRAALLVVPTLMGAIAGAAGIVVIFWLLAAALLAGAVLAARTPFDELVDRGGGRRRVGDGGRPGPGGEGEDLDAAAKAAEASAPAAEV